MAKEMALNGMRSIELKIFGGIAIIK